MMRLFLIVGTISLLLLGLGFYRAAFKDKNLDGKGVVFVQ
jgi:hypothetical protein